MSSQYNTICFLIVLDCVMLCPNMEKTKKYLVTICQNSSSDVHTAYCVCPAGSAVCCNHITVLLYALEEFVRLGFREESKFPCTSRLQQSQLRSDSSGNVFKYGSSCLLKLMAPSSSESSPSSDVDNDSLESDVSMEDAADGARFQE